MAGIITDVDAVIDDGRERSDDRAEARRVKSVDQAREVLRERVEHDRRGNIRDELAQSYGPPVLIAGNLLVKEAADRFVACDRRRENKEAEEREQEHIVHAEEQLAIDDQYDRDHDHDRDIPKLSAAHNRREDHDKEREVAHAALPSGRFPRLGDLLRVDLDPPAVLFSVHNAYEHNEQDRRSNAERCHMQHKIRRTRAGLLIKEQVLRTAERHQKRSADRSDIFKSNNGENTLLTPRTPEEQDRERNKDDERNVIRHKHG